MRPRNYSPILDEDANRLLDVLTEDYDITDHKVEAGWLGWLCVIAILVFGIITAPLWWLL